MSWEGRTSQGSLKTNAKCKPGWLGSEGIEKRRVKLGRSGFTLAHVYGGPGRNPNSVVQAAFPNHGSFCKLFTGTPWAKSFQVAWMRRGTAS